MPHLSFSLSTKISFALFLLIPFQLLSQKSLMTQSGQEIILQNDNSWTRSAATIDSLSLVRSQYAVTQTILNSQAQNLDDFLNSARDKEAWSRIMIDNTYEDISSQRLNLKLSKKDKVKKRIIKQNIKSLKSLLKTVNKEQKYYAYIIKKAEKLYSVKPVQFERSFLKLSKKVWKNKGWAIPSMNFKRKTTDLEIDDNKLVDSTTEEDNAKKELQSSMRRQKTPKRQAVIPITSRNEARILYDDFDEDAEAHRKQVTFQPLFSYTHPKMKSYFKNQAYMTGSSSISKVGKDYYIVLDITMLSKDASRAYGLVRQTDQVRFSMIDGTQLYATVIRDSQGKLQEYTGYTKYTIVAKVKKSTLKKIRDSYIDTVGIIWSSGFEEYPIYDLAILKNQASLLLN